jgi:hypothetical protein
MLSRGMMARNYTRSERRDALMSKLGVSHMTCSDLWLLVIGASAMCADGRRMLELVIPGS